MKSLVEKWLEGHYAFIRDSWQTRDGEYFLIEEDDEWYVLRVQNNHIYNVRNDLLV